MPTAIAADGLVKTYPTRRGAPVEAIRGLSFEVPRGAVFGMLGPNGAGKSTTIRILTTLALPTSGSARVAGADVVEAPGRVRARIGYVSQGTSSDPLLTACENLVLAGRLRGMTRADARARAEALLSEFGLRDAADRPAGRFSGGMRRRLDVAVALVHRPEILFLDEPTTGLDPQSRAAMWAEIRRLADDSFTVVISTHYLDEADRLADRVMIVDRGRRLVEGTPHELKSSLEGETLRIALHEPDRAAVRAAALRAGLADVVVQADGPAGTLVARVDDAARVLGRLLTALADAGVSVGATTISAPSLDDVYLHHVGRSFDAAEAEHRHGAAA